jgi:hypothetical protein
MPIKRRKAAPKKRTSSVKKKSTSRVTGIAAYVRKIQSSLGVKRATATIKSLEAKLKAAKKKKAAAVKVARKKLK